MEIFAIENLIFINVSAIAFYFCQTLYASKRLILLGGKVGIYYLEINV